jgi:CHAD domain-containing protein
MHPQGITNMSTPAPREIELKYTVRKQSQWKSLRDQEWLLEGYRLGPINQRETIDVYWDTVDYALTRGGFGLRTRRHNHPGLLPGQPDVQWQVTLKETKIDPQNGLADRVEVEDQLTAKVLDTLDSQPTLKIFQRVLAQQGWPPSAKEQVILHKAAPKLQPIAILHQKRGKRTLYYQLPEQGGSQDETIGEMSLDYVQVYAPPPEPFQVSRWTAYPENALQRAGDFYEIEFEAASIEQHQHYLSLAEQLPQVYSVRASLAGKAGTALQHIAQLAADGLLGVRPTLPINLALRLIWRRQLTQLLINESAVRHFQDEEAVHDMRVAIRRMRAAALIFSNHVSKAELRPLLKMLRATARILGHARDLDVSASLLQRYRSAAGADLHTKEVDATWQAQRQEAYNNAQEWLESKAYSRLIKDLARFCNVQPESLRANSDDAPIAHQVRHVFPTEILKCYANVRAYEAAITEDAVLEVFHALRIEAKRLRYAIEFVRHLLAPEETSLLLKKLKAVQNSLGQLNDADTLQKRLISRPETVSDSSARQDLIAYLDQVIAEEKEKFSPLWLEFLHIETRRQLALAIAHL